MSRKWNVRGVEPVVVASLSWSFKHRLKTVDCRQLEQRIMPPRKRTKQVPVRHNTGTPHTTFAQAHCTVRMAAFFEFKLNID